MRWRARRRSPPDGQEGFLALELAIVTPVVIVMLLVVVAFGRVTQGRAVVDQAAAAAARAASLADGPGQARIDAEAVAEETLAQAGLSCTRTSVELDTRDLRPGGRVTATVHCLVDLSALAMAGVPGTLHLDSSATCPLETYRDLPGVGP